MANRMFATALLSAAILVGCQSHQSDKSDYDDDAKEVEITRDQVPAVVQASFDKAFPGVKIKEIKKETYADGTVHYEFEYLDKDGKEHEVELADDGEVLDDH